MKKYEKPSLAVQALFATETIAANGFDLLADNGFGGEVSITAPGNWGDLFEAP